MSAADQEKFVISLNPPSRGSEQFVARFPDGMRDRIKAAAKANGRSMNAEIIIRLSESFSREDDLAIPAAYYSGAAIDRIEAKLDGVLQCVPVPPHRAVEFRKYWGLPT